MQEEQSKSTDAYLRKKSTAAVSAGMTAWLLAYQGVTAFSVGCALTQACAAVSNC